MYLGGHSRKSQHYGNIRDKDRVNPCFMKMESSKFSAPCQSQIEHRWRDVEVAKDVKILSFKDSQVNRNNILITKRKGKVESSSNRSQYVRQNNNFFVSNYTPQLTKILQILQSQHDNLKHQSQFLQAHQLLVDRQNLKLQAMLEEYQENFKNLQGNPSHKIEKTARFLYHDELETTSNSNDDSKR